MKKVIIAEKPSLAMTIVKAIGNNFKKEDGYFENDKYIVTFAYGHLFELYSIDDYFNREKTPWNINELPFIPKDFKFKLSKDSGIKKQFSIIKNLVNRKDVDTIVNCGDADREGEVIIRLVLEQALETTKNIKRLWLPEQTETSIRVALENLNSSNEYDLLYKEGLLRTYVDWLYGINLTRLLSLKSSSFLPVGRVLIPIVHFIYNRDYEINNFKPKTYFEPEITIIKDNEKIKFNLNELKSDTKDLCLNALKDIDKTVIVKDIEVKEIKRNPKKLFSLDKLQNKLSKKLKISASESLNIVQSLYEKGYVTYPRTNTEYLAETEKDKVKQTINTLNTDNTLEFKDKKSIFDTSKIESHSAITPTLKLPSNLSHKEEQVYNIIKNRFIANFLIEECILEETVIHFILDTFEFNLKGTTIKSPGYLRYENDLKEKSIPRFNKNETFEPFIEVLEKKTQPPKHITLEDLNNHLKNPFKTEKTTEDEEYKMMFEGVEIGTSATRAGIIEKAVKLKYIREDKGTFYIDKLGIDLINTLNKLNVNLYKEKTVELSKILKKVYKNELDINKALDIYSKDISNLIVAAKVIEVSKIEREKVEKEIIGTCPKCSKNVYESEKVFYCEGFKDNPKCTFTLFKKDKFFESKGKKITKTIAKSLLSKKTVKVKGLKKKDGNGTYDANIVMSLNGNYINFKLVF